MTEIDDAQSAWPGSLNISIENGADLCALAVDTISCLVLVLCILSRAYRTSPWMLIALQYTHTHRHFAWWFANWLAKHDCTSVLFIVTVQWRQNGNINLMLETKRKLLRAPNCLNLMHKCQMAKDQETGHYSPHNRKWETHSHVSVIVRR